MNPKLIVLDPSKCTGCNDCINKCKEIHGISRVKKAGNIPIFCMQCENAPCMNICPVNAIYLKENIPIVNKERCIGCGMCEIACPIGAIFIEEKVAHKCTLCLDTDRITPACVEACKDNALKLICDECLDMIKDDRRNKLIKIISEEWRQEI
ncbi:4Fe-4S dicluster domain-containing protein [Methanothermococcus okinawensis]|uniref:Ferredoxin n=1 Tax=Methanothermococcus okinawensis (strain DSM 14208 / JCM 11175 / IH1) TaxID=647113 RepID=F8AM37_METOI|nr:4Fe-4S dicluster domain-containing protein [Methanothermococcus okinawensis]AEH06722.1 4Fe-4S ferredoxin iron-sulfur binding domain-containing protein [Methanothermococcus okinawensis IH1]